MNEQEKRYTALLSRLAESGFRFCPLETALPAARQSEALRKRR